MTLAISDGVALITIDRLETRNALTAAMRRDFASLVVQLDDSADVRAIVLTGANPAFTSGVDLKDLLAGNRMAPTVRPHPGEVLSACATPVIAAVNGPCVTGGLEIALSCSFIVASERATFRDTQARLGLMPGWGLSALLPRAVGIRLAREMTLTGRTVDASEALAASLVNRVVPAAELLPSALSLARSVAEADPVVVRAALSLYERGDGLPLEAALAVEQEALSDWRAHSARVNEAAGDRPGPSELSHQPAADSALASAWLARLAALIEPVGPVPGQFWHLATGRAVAPDFVIRLGRPSRVAESLTELCDSRPVERDLERLDRDAAHSS